LVSDIEANLEAIHNSGFRFVSGNVQDLRDHLDNLLKNSVAVDQMGEEARATVEVNFSWPAIVTRIESVYITARH